MRFLWSNGTRSICAVSQSLRVITISIVSLWIKEKFNLPFLHVPHSGQACAKVYSFQNLPTSTKLKLKGK